MKHIAGCWVLGAWLFFCVPGVSCAEVIDKIIAILDHDLILLSEIREQIAKPVVLIIANVQGSSQPEHDALPYLIERRLLKREIQYLAFPKEKERMKELAFSYLARTYKHDSPDELRRKLRQAGISDTDVEDELLSYMKGMDYIRRKHRFSDDIESPQVVMELFQTWIERLNASITLQMIP